FYGSNVNNWNTTKQSGTNIVGGLYLGGNYWAYPNGTGFSQTCSDANKDGICDSIYELYAGNKDFLPLKKRLTGTISGFVRRW
ncbi:MAG TPA: NosD domain-containing protein, partial [Candidatus Methanoperedens sp.]|nr:NosD domain-containing protein [Candidatus Methanoperedens sp.]